MVALNNMSEDAAAVDGSNDDNNISNSPTSPPRLVNIAIDSSLDDNIDDKNNANNNNRLSTPTKKALQDIKEESYNNNDKTENAVVECINQLSFSSSSSPTTKMTTTIPSSSCKNTIGSSNSASSSTSNNSKPLSTTAVDDTNDCNSDSPTNEMTTTSTTNNSTQLPSSSTIQKQSSKLDVTITVLSLHGIISKHIDKKSSTTTTTTTSSKKKKGKNNNSGGEKKKKEESATIIASFTQQITSDKVFLTHVPSLPVSLNSSTSSNDSMDKQQNTGENNGKKKKGGELQSLNVNWASSESLVDDARSAPFALSTINFTKEFIHENNNKSPTTKSIATNDGTMSNNNSSNISVDCASTINSKQSKKSSSSTIKSSSTSTTKTNKANKTDKQQHYMIPQTIPINLSISRSNKMILLGKVNLVVNGEENGETSLSVPIVSSIKDNTKKLKPIKKLKLRKNKNGGGEVLQNNKGSSEADNNRGMVKMKGDAYSFGLENNAMLRVLVNVTNPNHEKDTTANKDDDVDFDATVQGSIEDCNEESSILMEGLSIEQVSSNDSSLENDYYQSYNMVPISNELRTLRTQIAQLDNTNKILQMELSTANNTISNECNMVAALHDENKVLRDELEEVHDELEKEIFMSRSTTNNKDNELEDENEELKCQIEELKMSLDVIPILQDEVEKLRNELAERRSKCCDISGSSSSMVSDTQDLSSPTIIPTSSSTTTADAIAATLRTENTKLRTELIRAQSNATTLLGELNTSKSESEMLPFYERRVNELLEELKKRDLEVSCLKDELSEAHARAKSSLVEGLLWDDDDDDEDNVEEEEDNTATGGGGGGGNRLSLAARKLAAAAESHVLAKHGLKAREISSSGESSALVEDDGAEEQVQVQDEEGKKLLAEIDRVYAADKSEGSSSRDGDTESTSTTPSTEESIDKAAKGSGDTSVADTEATTPERDTAAADPPLMRDWGSPVEQTPDDDDANDDDDTKKGSRGLGLRGLGSRLKAAEEKMRERQQLFREQQQKVLAEQQRLAELEKQNAEPGLSDVLIARMASSRKTSDDDDDDDDTEQENAKESSAAQEEEGPHQDIKQEEAPLSSAAGDDDSSMDTEAKAESMAQVSNTLNEIETMSNEVTRRESQQGLLLENMDSLEQEFGLRSMTSHDELVPSAPSAGDPKDDLEGSVVSKEKKSKGIMSRIKKVGKKNKKSKEEGTEENKDVIEEEVDSQTQPGGSTSTEDLNTTQDLSSDPEDDNVSYKEFIQVIGTDELLDRKESTGSADANHIGTVVA